MQWNSSYFYQDPLDPLLLHDDENLPSLNEFNLEASALAKLSNTSDLLDPPHPSANLILASNPSTLNHQFNDDFAESFSVTLNEDFLSINESSSSLGKSNTSPLSTISTSSLSVETVEPEVLRLSDPHSSNYNYNPDPFPNPDDILDINRDINPTINVTALTKSPHYWNNSVLQHSPILKSQSFQNRTGTIEPSNANMDMEDAASKNEDEMEGEDDIQGHLENDDSIEGDSYLVNPSDSKVAGLPKSNKKISDSRLSLAQLSIVLNLDGNDEETAKREKNILNILKNDLMFPIGEKTWIRDTPSFERERIMNELTKRVEDVYKYGYSKKTLSIIVRRASYYMMQGRLRRERRLKRKRKNLENKKTAL